MLKRIVTFGIDRPKVILWMTLLVVVASLLSYPRIKVDTDPENMLPDTASARVFHWEVKREFAVYDMVVVGVINKKDPEGVFNVETLTKIYRITEEIKNIPGVISSEIYSLSTKDNIEQGGIGEVKFDWLMAQPPASREEALAIRAQAQDHPMLYGSVVSEDGQALCLYIPVERKDLSYLVVQDIKKIVARYPGDEEFHFTGLPIANDQFGVEMFKQMAVSAPLAGLAIFLLMWFFFKSLVLIVAPMIVAIATVVITMGLLIGFGFPVHIMSSMIPIFLMPIAVLDCVHILSDFSEKYRVFHDQKKTITVVMNELFSPMLYTTLTTFAGFFSLSFSAIPPVQVFGIAVAVGVAIAWVLTMTFIPAYIMLMDPKKFSGFRKTGDEEKSPYLDRILSAVQFLVSRHAKKILAATIILVAVAIYGITRIQVNDNPVRWFTPTHSLRIADRVLNDHFAGTYEAYLVLEAADKSEEIFIQPQVMRYVENLQEALLSTGLVGKTTSLVDVTKKIYYELLGGDKVNNVIPPTKEAVAQCLISFENSHKPDDLWHMTTPDYSKVNIWLQLKSGDNKYMAKVVKFVDQYMQDHPAPQAMTARWAGLTYINVVWQNNMVVGMLNNFLGSFIIVLFMMLFLFRSPVKALISMIPLSVTILFIYSLLGFFGKDYDMPVAVLSALTLGLSVDFAIHYIQRISEINHHAKDWKKAATEMFTGPGRAIIRNALVVAIGFLPLLAAPLVPYKTVGFFMFTIMAFSSIATLFILPAIVYFKPQWVLDEDKKTVSCHCGSCMLVALFVALAVAYVLLGYTPLGWKTTTWISILVIVGLAALCHIASKRSICLNERGEK